MKEEIKNSPQSNSNSILGNNSVDQVNKLRYCPTLLRKSQSSLKISAATRTVFSMPKLHISSEVQYSPKN